jgi:2,4-dienoyl-CoA reductase-like NADH-dependent reductase (Old Yellow Enzyme family)
MTLLMQQPGRIGPLRMKNRLIMAPMGTNFSTSDGISSVTAPITKNAPRVGLPPS